MTVTAWIVWCPELGGGRDGAGTIRAVSAEAAARQWGQNYDQRGDYDLARGATYVVMVAEDREGSPEQRFEVRAEPSVDYFAQELAAEDVR
jgi:hypothetical protein